MKEQDLTQHDIAGKVDVSQPTVQRWLSGTMPGGGELYRLAQSLGKPVEYFFSDRPVMETLHFKPNIQEQDLESAIAAMDELKQKVIVLDKALRKLRPKEPSSSTSRISEGQAILKRAGDKYDAGQHK